MRTMLLTSPSFLLLVACCGTHPNPGTGEPPASKKLCGGLVGRSCAATEYCDYANNSCGDGDQTGTCKPRPEFCTAIEGPPTCACNGMLYHSECGAYRNGSDLNARGTCNVAAGMFPCGYLQCNLDSQYCLREVHASSADTYSCIEQPACADQPPGCACLASERCGDACAGSTNVGFTLTCP